MRKLSEILLLPEGPPCTAALVSWLQGLYEAETEKPILVGGAAVELYTGGAYTTGDLDLVGVVPSSVASSLKDAGFERRGRHFIHEVGQVFIEFPSSSLGSDEESVVLEVEGCQVLVVEPEALIADRLAAWQVWRSPQDGVNAWLIARNREIDQQRVRHLAKARGVPEAAGALEESLKGWRGRDPAREELIAWAQTIPGE